MNKKLHTYIAVVAVIGIFVPAVSFAATGSLFDSVINVLQDKIFEFQRRVDDLKNTIDLRSEKDGKEFTEYLYEGKQGKEVIKLQKLLSQYPDIYPEGVVTGYYGQLTKNAVLRFQKKYEISPVGVVGPETRSKLNQIVSSINRNSSSTSQQGGGVMMTPEPKAEIERDSVSTSVESLNLSHSLESKPNYNKDLIENKIQEEVNKKREERGLEKLEWDKDIYEVAKEHSEDQAEDSRALVDSDKPCSFPILRHEGFESGLTVGDRLESENIDYKKAGENLVLFPLSKNMIYRYKVSEGKPKDCPELEQVDFSESDSIREKRALLNEEIQERKNILDSISEVEWINRQWKESDEIASQAVDMWMNSEGHRHNLLNSEFDKGSIGVSFVGDFIVVTHVLVEK